MTHHGALRSKIGFTATALLSVFVVILLSATGSVASQPLLFVSTPSVTYSSGGYALGMMVADVNGDGKPDLIMANCGTDPTCGGNSSVGVLLGNGDGTFQPVVTYASGGIGADSVAVVDVNGDGKPDIVVANCGSQFDCFGDGIIGVLLGNGDGTFQPPAIYGTGGGPAKSVVAADLNHDGKPDLIVANCSGNCSSYGSVGVLLGNGDGTFQPVVTYFSGAMGTESVAVGDVNADGNLDIVAADCGSVFYCSSGNGLVTVLLGNGDGTFQGYSIYNSGGSRAFSVAVADVNGDHKLDLLVTNSSSCTVGELLGNGDGTFQPAVLLNGCGLDPIGGPGSLIISDVNGDAKPDLLFTTNGVAVSLGNDDGTFQPLVTYNTGRGGGPFAVADVNGDGKPDIIMVTNAGVAVLLNNNGAPPTTTTVAASVNPIVFNQPVTYTATVKPPASGIMTGTVTFMDGLFVVGDVPVSGNQAALTLTYTYVSTHSITAIYSGQFKQAAGSVSNTITQYVQGTSTTLLTSSGSPSVYGQPVTFSARVKSKYGTIPDGEPVSFYDGTTLLGAGALAGGLASFTTSTLIAKNHVIAATYPGDSKFAPSSRTIVQAVKGVATSTALVSSVNPSVYGQAVTWTATVTTSGSIPPTGRVTFISGISIGSATLNSAGVATLTRSNLTAGAYPITAVYHGDSYNASSTSPVLNQVVRQAGSSATLISSPNPSTSGQAVTFTATITSPTANPIGSVTFSVGTTVLGAVQLSGRKAKFTTSALAVGSTEVTATYDGNANIAGSSASVTQNVN